MALVLEQMLTKELGDASYLIGDDSARIAAVVDPQVDVEQYLELARKHGLAIKYVVQTHIHEDFVSGACALAAAAGSAQVCVSGHDAPTYGFEHRLVHDGDVLELGSVQLTVKHTPGHTPEHISLLVAKTSKKDAPFAVLSGGSLLVETAGRTDLLGPEHTEVLTSAQFNTLYEFFRGLDEGVLVYPTHVHGSPCGAAIGDKLLSTIGYEFLHNELLRQPNEAKFRERALGNLPPKPSYYPRLKDVNTDAPPRPADVAAVPALPPKEFKSLLGEPDVVVVDTRHMLAFGGGHIAGALNFGATGHLSIQAGWMIDPEKRLLLVLESDSQLSLVLKHLARTGFTRFAGYLAGGLSAWENAGYGIVQLPQMHVTELAALSSRPDGPVIVDVRAPEEWARGHVPGARHIFLPELPAKLSDLRKNKPVVVYCDSGYRASIAASILKSNEFEVSNVPGSWQAWTKNALPVEKNA
ncbi:MBL fold metallo-hydrolase [Caenimonas sedimenti]|uniref:MBL fold metallo-hydrolase n=1 Tax=Caenimonas sedimenti TaxID=2596921 RepID=A0A562ZNU5_9BURK|nr:MBL fold metallo-hydrolase [Caenimonas sedimenti]TWO70077.1 MBL fold metallo-hydrolase [Caenimonas sedimenti]